MKKCFLPTHTHGLPTPIQAFLASPLRYCLRLWAVICAFTIFFIFLHELLQQRQSLWIPMGPNMSTPCHHESWTTPETTPANPDEQDVTLKPLCPKLPSELGRVNLADFENTTNNDNSTSELEYFMADNAAGVRPGGFWEPTTCTPRYRTAIIIPFRDRESHLRILLRRLHSLLQKQMIAYGIFVAEQAGHSRFNKGRIMNTAFLYIRNRYPHFDCVIFHDVDMLPEDDGNMYACSDRPKHLSPAVNEMKYQLPYKELVGGVFAVPTSDFIKVNGYSNSFWGWGGEDDDMYYRLEAENLTIDRSAFEVGRYSMIQHKKRVWEKPYKYVRRLLDSSKKRYTKDGLEQVLEVGCSILHIGVLEAYSHIWIDIGPETLWNSKEQKS